MNDTIELFPGVQFRKDTTKPLGNQWLFLHEEHWLIAKLAYADDIMLDHVAQLIAANGTVSAINVQRRNRLVDARKAAGIGPDDDLVAAIEALHARIADDERKIDLLLAHCPDGECTTCGEIICPHGGAMHFHHDGCPSCAEHDADDIPDFSPGYGNKARRRAAALNIDMDASVKAGEIVRTPPPWSEVAEPVPDDQR